MRTLRIVIPAAIAALAVAVPAQPVQAGRGFAYDSVYSHQSIANYQVNHDVPATISDVRVAVKLYSKKQTDLDGFTVTQINLDVWRSGTNPANSPCPGFLDDDAAVEGDLHLLYLNASGGYTLLRSWHIILGNGDGCHDVRLGGSNTVATNANGIAADFEMDVMRVDQGPNIGNRSIWVKRNQTGATTWSYGCGWTQGLIQCNQDGPL